MFLKPPTAVVARGRRHLGPRLTADRLRGRAGRGVQAAGQAHVPRGPTKTTSWGYACANDVSARDFQRGDGQWARAKGSDTFCPLGPWIETELDPGNLRISASSTAKCARTAARLTWPLISFLISHLTKYFTMEPGDVLITGTPAGIGEMNPGDEYEVTIEGIGSLKNRMTRAR